VEIEIPPETFAEAAEGPYLPAARHSPTLPDAVQLEAAAAVLAILWQRRRMNGPAGPCSPDAMGKTGAKGASEKDTHDA